MSFFLNKFGGQLHRVDILFHQGNPLFSIRCGLYGSFYRFVKLPYFCFKLLLLVLVLLGQRSEVILGYASGKPVLIHFSKQPVTDFKKEALQRKKAVKTGTASPKEFTDWLYQQSNVIIEL